uniref:DUF4806 domain-containing protein n=1 Tax=Amblyomma maculatum TaxID=34609 RepID=G3MPT3_AMBMU
MCAFPDDGTMLRHSSAARLGLPEMAKPFAVVKFPTEDDSVAVVPVVWLSPDWTECHWPVTRNSEITRLAKEQADPSAFPGYRWQMCQVAVVTTSRTYNSAEKKVTKYQYNSAVESSALSGNEYPDEAVRLPSPPPASPEHILSGDGDAENQEPAEEPAARSDTTATEHQTQLKVLRMLYEIRQQQRDSEHRVLQHQEAVLGRLASLEAAIAQAARSPEAEATVTNPKLPAYTLAELEAAEAAVKNDTVATALRKQLMRLGGGSLKEVASNIMTSIMGVEVQRLYSLHGRKGKKAFISMRLCRVATARRHSTEWVYPRRCVEVYSTYNAAQLLPRRGICAE